MTGTSRWAALWIAGVLALGAGASGLAAAAPASSEGAGIASAGTPSGATACASCHGGRGEGLGAFPRLAGTGAAYLREQLEGFASGARPNPIMQPIAKALSPEQRTLMAAYYAGLPGLKAVQDREPRDSQDTGAWLATRGRWADGLPACAQCHGPGGGGVGSQFPPLAGQPSAYLAGQLKAWQSGQRPPGPLGLMEAMARKLQDTDIQAISDYYSQLGQAAPAAAPSPGTQGAASAPISRSSPESVRTNAPPTPAAAAVAAGSASSSQAFTPPSPDTIPNDAYGKMIRLGEKVFTETGTYARKYVGNDLACVNCHLDAGRKPDSAPLWASFIHYPAFRAKTGQVDTLASRLQGCFQYSMNGKAPPADDEVITALQTYAFFLAKGAPVGVAVEGSGYPKLKKPAQPADYARGEKVYAQNCAMCHGAHGQGQRTGERQVFPPLWGPRSFNWGAGMHQINNAAGFIHANMPLGKGRSLTEQEAWDVAFFMNSHERPQDPRFTGSVAETRRKYHDTEDSLYGRTVNGRVLGSPAR